MIFVIYVNKPVSIDQIKVDLAKVREDIEMGEKVIKVGEREYSINCVQNDTMCEGATLKL